MEGFNFTIEHYNNLNEYQRQVVDDWLRRYHLMDKLVFIEKMDEDETLTRLKLVAWGISDIDLYREPGQDPAQITEELTHIRVLAEFEYDDFPWEVLNTKEQ